MPYKSEAQRKMMHAKHPEIAKRWDKIHNSKAYKTGKRGKKMAGSSPQGGFARAIEARLAKSRGSVTPSTPPTRRVQPMPSGRSITMPKSTSSPTRSIPRPVGKPSGRGLPSEGGMPRFQMAARRRLAKVAGK